MEHTPLITDWIIAGSAVVSAFGILVLWGHHKEMQKQVLQWKKLVELQASAADRSRTEYGIQTLLNFISNLEQPTSAARKLVETLSEDETKKVYDEEPLELAGDKRQLLDACLKTPVETAADGRIHLGYAAVSEIRWKTITYLNALEAVMTASLYNIVEQEFFSKQFSYLVNDTKGHAALAKFRKAAGIESYPGIEEFVKRTRSSRSASAPTPAASQQHRSA
jgi:hypothetical protein